MDLTSPLALIENTILRIRAESVPALASTTHYLETLYERMKDALHREGTISPQETPPAEVAEIIFLYTDVVCDYFRSLKRIRPLTEEERQIGDQLRQVLRRTTEALFRRTDTIYSRRSEPV